MLPRVPVLAALALLAAGCGFFISSNADRGAYDFQAFYCAGAAVRAHADPYKAQPLGACERRVTSGTYAALPADVILPAPQPGYDLAAFEAISALPFDRAKALFGALLAIALTLAVVCVWAATQAPLGIVLAAFVASLVMPALAFGELFAFFAAAACAALYFASRGQWSAAGAAAALSLVEPHLGLPICAALIIWKPQTRAAMVITIAALLALAVATLGVGPNLEYVAVVLPLHSLAEISSDAQLSLSAILHAAGVSDAAAIQIGTLSYLALAALGVLVARALSERAHNDTFLVGVPAAFAAIGGTFIHVTELFAAIPLALLLRHRSAAALVLLAVPWFTALEPGNALAFALLGAIATSYLTWCRKGAQIVTAFAAGAFAFGVLYGAPKLVHGNAPHSPPPTRISDSSYPQASWQAWNYRALSTNSDVVWLLRGLSWVGLLVLAATAVQVSRRAAAPIPAAAQSTPSVR